MGASRNLPLYFRGKLYPDLLVKVIFEYGEWTPADGENERIKGELQRKKLKIHNHDIIGPVDYQDYEDEIEYEIKDFTDENLHAMASNLLKGGKRRRVKKTRKSKSRRHRRSTRKH